MGVQVKRHILGFAWIYMLDQVAIHYKQVRSGHGWLTNIRYDHLVTFHDCSKFFLNSAGIDGSQPSWYSNRQAATELHFAMITRMARRSQKTAMQHQRKSSEWSQRWQDEIKRMITVMPIQDQRKSSEWSQWWQCWIKRKLVLWSRPAVRFSSRKFDPCVVNFACFFSGKTRWDEMCPSLVTG